MLLEGGSAAGPPPRVSRKQPIIIIIIIAAQSAQISPGVHNQRQDLTHPRHAPNSWKMRQSLFCVQGGDTTLIPPGFLGPQKALLLWGGMGC